MKHWYVPAGLILCLAPFTFSQTSDQANPPKQEQTNPPQQGPANPPKQQDSGEQVTVKHQTSTVQKPVPKPADVDASVVTAAQKALTDRGYHPGPIDGKDGPQMRSAVSKFQTDQGLKPTGELDTNTLTKLNVGGTRVIGSAPSDLGRGGKAAGHDTVQGHPVDATKAMGSGIASFGKKIGKGTKSMTVEGVEKMGKGISSVGDSITGGAKGKSSAEAKNKPATNQPNAQTTPSTTNTPGAVSTPNTTPSTTGTTTPATTTPGTNPNPATTSTPGTTTTPEPTTTPATTTPGTNPNPATTSTPGTTTTPESSTTPATTTPGTTPSPNTTTTPSTTTTPNTTTNPATTAPGTNPPPNPPDTTNPPNTPK